MTHSRKKLIEVALPLIEINASVSHETMPGIGPHPRGLHTWWARRPLAAARAVIFGQMVDDPSSLPELFPTEEAQEKERQRLFGILEELVKWESTTNERILQAARDEIWESWRRCCDDNADHPESNELFNRDQLPGFHDPFAGGGALPLEAQRLGMESYASDLNPVAVMINKAMIEIPPKFAGQPPVNPESRGETSLVSREWNGAQGLAEDVRYYGQWMRDEAEKRIGHLYPKVEITAEMAKERSDLEPYIGQKLTVIAWLWARTVKSPNPAFAEVDVPLVTNFMLSTNKGKEAYVEPVIENGGYRFKVKAGTPPDLDAIKKGTKIGRGTFGCLMSGTPLDGNYLRAEGKAGRMGSRLLAIVLDGDPGRVYLSPNPEHEDIVRQAEPGWKPDVEFFQEALGFRVANYGMTKWSDLFTDRQSVALSTFSDLVQETSALVESDAVASGLADDGLGLNEGGDGALGYAGAVKMFLYLPLSRCTGFNTTLCRWGAGNQKVMSGFGRQVIPMVWDFAEAAILNKVVGGFGPAVDYISKCITTLVSPDQKNAIALGSASQEDAAVQSVSASKVISTDPPYYDNIGYADLSDFFYVWMRRSLKSVFPDLFSTVVAPKVEELVATPARHGGKKGAEVFFLDGMTQAMYRLAEQSHPGFPVTIYYAFKAAERKGGSGVTRTGWETFLEAVIHAGFTITGTWPMATEQETRMRANKSNALATNVILACRKREGGAPTAMRREFIRELQEELPLALADMQRSNIAPVDMAQASIGPGMAIYTRYSKVINASGELVTVHDALSLINQIKDATLSQEESDLDADSRWAVTWFEESGFEENDFGQAETLATARNTSVQGLVEAGIVVSRRGKTRLLKPEELPDTWDPATDTRLTAWEIVHHLVRVLESGGERVAAEVIAKLGSQAEIARDLAYQLYSIADTKERAGDALRYNSLVQSWPEMAKLAYENRVPAPSQADIFDSQ